jgi:hypothetical protein
VLTIQAYGVYVPGNHFKPRLIFENVVEVPYGAPLNEVENHTTAMEKHSSSIAADSIKKICLNVFTCKATPAAAKAK